MILLKNPGIPSGSPQPRPPHAQFGSFLTTHGGRTCGEPGFSCGIDVFQIARNNGFPIEVAKNRSSAQNYYGVVLIEEIHRTQ